MPQIRQLLAKPEEDAYLIEESEKGLHVNNDSVLNTFGGDYEYKGFTE